MNIPKPDRSGALPWLAGLLLIAWSAVFGQAQRPPPAAVTGAGQALQPSCPAPGPNNDYSGKTLVLCNFNRAKLQGAKFTNATLTAVSFDGANLSGADFSGAVFADSGDAMLPTDFSFANLDHAIFNGATFNGLTYLTQACLTNADFSNTDISTPNAVFGPSPLRLDDKSPGCSMASKRTTFKNTVMSCEFVADWNRLDLTGANVAKCRDQFKGHDFSGGVFANVVFDGADLSGSRWSGADLTGASFQSAILDGATGLAGTAGAPSQLTAAAFNNASVQGVDLSNALLYGANFTNANLTNSNLQGSFFTAEPSKGVLTAAKFDGAHMRDVNLGGAKLAGVTFGGASFYGSFGGTAPSFPCQTDVTTCPGSATGATCACASAVGADLTNTDFSSAFLYGVDFGGAATTINGTKFNGAVLVAANFADANFTVAQGGVPPDFTDAQLMGTNLGGNTLNNTSLSGAFVDFGTKNNPNKGNLVQLLLPAKYTSFRGFWNGKAAPICVQVAYGDSTSSGFTTVPTTSKDMTCPDGMQSGTGCGPTTAKIPLNPNWNNGLSLGGATPPGFFFLDSTYETANQTTSCNAGSVDPKW